MSALTYDDVVVAEPVRFWTRERRTGVILGGIGVLSAVGFGALATDQNVKFTLTDNPAGAAINVNGTFGAVLFGLITVVAGAAMWYRGARRFYAWLLGVGIVGVVLSSLCWQISSAPSGLSFMPLVDIVRGTFLLALPLIFGSLAGVMCERSGVVNVAIEGQLLTGAFGGALAGSVAGNVWIGIIGGMLGGVLISVLLAWFCIRYLVDQVVLGIVLNLLALGLTGFIYEQVMRPDTEHYDQPPRVPLWHIPLLSKLPVLGPSLFTGTIFLFLAIALVIVISVALFRTRWGLRTRAVGEHPTAADTVGINVRRVRWRNVLLGGAIAGIGGAYYTLDLVGAFTKNMIGGKGFIALAALIFGRWSPVGAMLAALLFGFADKLSGYLTSISSPIPGSFLSMLPYVATIFAVAGLVGRVRAPAADGKPYEKG
jgi:general nucleoside transport system permease protein